MRKFLVVALLLGGHLSIAHAQKSSADQELAQLAGTWRQMSQTYMGSPMPPVVLGSRMLSISHDSATLTIASEIEHGLLVVRPDRTPKEIDLTFGADKIWRGIYQVEGATLRIHWAIVVPGVPPEERPTTFVVSPRAFRSVMTYERVR